MTAKEFVELFHTEKNNLLKLYFKKPQTTMAGMEIDSLGLTDEQMEKMRNIINLILTDTMYTILLGLDGGTSIGGQQQTYELYDESGNKISECGEIEEYAYEYFQETE